MESLCVLGYLHVDMHWFVMLLMYRAKSASNIAFMHLACSLGASNMSPHAKNKCMLMH